MNTYTFLFFTYISTVFFAYGSHQSSTWQIPEGTTFIALRVTPQDKTIPFSIKYDEISIPKQTAAELLVKNNVLRKSVQQHIWPSEQTKQEIIDTYNEPKILRYFLNNPHKTVTDFFIENPKEKFCAYIKPQLKTPVKRVHHPSKRQKI